MATPIDYKSVLADLTAKRDSLNAVIADIEAILTQNNLAQSEPLPTTAATPVTRAHQSHGN
jgi:hypothetical protein